MKNEIDKALEITKKEKRPALISFTVAVTTQAKNPLKF